MKKGVPLHAPATLCMNALAPAQAVIGPHAPECYRKECASTLGGSRNLLRKLIGKGKDAGIRVVSDARNVP